MGVQMQANRSSGSHPAIKFEQIPIVEGPLSKLERQRPQLLEDVVSNSIVEIEETKIESLLGEALYNEKARLKRQKFNPGNIWTLGRYWNDRKLWGQIQLGLKSRSPSVDKRVLLETALTHYAEEIGGHFDPRVYWLATHVVPWCFSWMLNASSVRRFLPWGMTESLQNRIHILGEVSSIQRLSKKGTILLVPTHQSHIDSVLIGYVIYLMSLPPFAYGAGLNLFSNPVLSFFLSSLGSYTVDRQKSNSLYKAALRHYSTEILRRGMHSIFFPGGGRSRSGAIESHLKLGLLSTAVQAQIDSYHEGRANPNVYIVPMVTSYHFVLEAASLVEEYLEQLGKHRFFSADIDTSTPVFFRTLHFFWKFFSGASAITVRIGRPLDVFGNLVDEEGLSIGPNGRLIDPKRWLTTAGELRSEPQRDSEYTRRLGTSLVHRYYRENTVLTSHAAAFAFTTALQKKYHGLDLYRFLRLSPEQRAMPEEKLLLEAENLSSRLRKMSDRSELFLCDELKNLTTLDWVLDGVKHLGYLHRVPVLAMEGGIAWSEDINLLYYYRNRLSGYGLSMLSDAGLRAQNPGEFDEKGFLA